MTAKHEHSSGSDLSIAYPRPTVSSRGLSFVTSYILIACLGFVALEAVNRARKNDPIASAEKSSIWWATKNWFDLTKAPDLVLLGSSLMIAAQNDCDATFFNTSFDAVTHYHSRYLEEKLSAKEGHAVTTASFVIGGQMASDAYAIVITLIEKNSSQKSLTDRKAETIIWGIAPRDFVDATFGRPEDTETVRLMNRIAKDDDILQLKRIPLWSRVENTFAKICSLYADRNELRSLENKSVESSVQKLAPSLYSSQKEPPPWILHQVSLAFPEDNRLGQWIVRPCKKKGDEPRDNSVEYQSRYQPYKAAQFAQQVSYFDKAIDAAKKQGDKMLIVNMPLTSENMKLLPPGVYDQYLSTVRDHATQRGAVFLDLNHDQNFSRVDFWDPVHLNGYGATKFMEDVIAALSRLEHSTI